MDSRGRKEVVRLEEDWYTHPAWYDILHAGGTAREVDGLTCIAERFVRTRGRAPVWLEPGCGTGRYLRVAAGRGIGVVGVDQCGPMLEYARRGFASRGLKGVFIEAPMADFSVPNGAEFAFCLINSIRHLASDRAMLAHLQCVAKGLGRGGVYAVGLSIIHPGAGMDSDDTWAGARGNCRVRQLISYLAPDEEKREERVISNIVVETPTRITHLDCAYTLRTYTLAQWVRLIGRSAMELVAVTDEWGEELVDLSRRGWAQELRTEYAIWVLRARK